MREILTEKIKVGEHILVNGVEYIAEEYDGCHKCAFNNTKKCDLIPCCTGGSFSFKKVKEDTLMTHSQLAEWCAKGCGQWKHSPSNSGIVYHYYWVREDNEDCFVEDNIVIRPWGTHEWVKPTLEIYEKSVKERE